jgi:Mg2+-importing ATPase
MDAVDLRTAATLPADEVLHRLQTTPDGLTDDEAGARLAQFGPNQVDQHSTTVWEILGRQFQNPFLILLICAALLSLGLHDRSDAFIILGIIVLSVGLSFANEFSAAKAVDDLRARVSRTALVVRAGKARELKIAELVPGDVVRLVVGDIVPADLRLTDVNHLECDESALTGEAMPTQKTLPPIGSADTAQASVCCAYSGTIVKNGAATGVVVATGRAAALGSIAHQLSGSPPQTRKFAAAIVAAGAWANGHHHVSAEILAKYLKVTTEQIDAGARYAYATSMTTQLLQPTIDLAARYGYLKAPFPAAEFAHQ